MRVLVIALVAALAAACASGGGGDPDLPRDANSPFPVERGQALPPPAPSGGAAAPPEGRGPGGIDFGQWRAADPATYAPAFQSQIRQRYAGQSNSQIRADLEANGFTCEENRLDSRIEIMVPQ